MLYFRGECVFYLSMTSSIPTSTCACNSLTPETFCCRSDSDARNATFSCRRACCEEVAVACLSRMFCQLQGLDGLSSTSASCFILRPGTGKRGTHIDLCLQDLEVGALLQQFGPHAVLLAALPRGHAVQLLRERPHLAATQTMDRHSSP